MAPPQPNVPTEVLAVTRTFLEAADAAAPGLVEALYLVGSVAQDDFRPDSSDIDFVAISEDRPDSEDLAALRLAHIEVRRRHSDVAFDGTHLCWRDLALNPDQCAPASYCYEGNFESSGRFAMNPVTWHELAHLGVPVRGPELQLGQVWCDDAVLRRWTIDNLRSYWIPWMDRYQTRRSDSRFDDGLVMWCVLGVPRLHYTIATGHITSKTGAGRYAMTTFDAKWKPIIIEALRVRNQPTTSTVYSDLSDRYRDANDFVRVVIADGLRLGERQD